LPAAACAGAGSVITLKSRREIELMRQAGGLVAEAHRRVRELIRPGITTGQIDAVIDRLFAEHQATPLFKGYPGKVPFPAATCVSVNEQVVHGIPGERVLIDGDLVSVDTGCRLNGWCGDSAWSYPVGTVDERKQRLLRTGEEVLNLAIRSLGECRMWSEVAERMQAAVRQAGYSLVQEFVGHGIGREMHEDPQVPNFPSAELKRNDFRIEPGLVLAIEPMINAGTPKVRILADHWTAETKDRQPSVHFEHTVAMMAGGPEILTL
jgi:methionyl aminopeptidase